MRNILLGSVSAAALLIAAPALANDSTSTVTQSSIGNNAQVDQTGSAVKSESTITQAGTGGNYANVIQRGVASGTLPINKSTIEQTGTSDEARVDQESFPGTNAKNTSLIRQAGTGAGSSAVVSQYGHNDSTVDQTNAGNFAQVLQGNSTTPQPSQPVGGNTSTVNQDGADTAYVRQNNDIPATGVGNYGANTSDIDQNDGTNYADVNQTGLYSTSSVTQQGGATAFVTQNGNNEDSIVNQNGTSTAYVTQSGGENRSLVTQAGNGNVADVGQSGTEVAYGLAPPNNDSTVSQTGNNASAIIRQTGELNRSQVGQAGDSDADVAQEGVYNESHVTQTATATGASALVRQKGVPASGGPGVGQGDNLSNISQSNGAAYASVNQTANNPTNGFPSNDSTINQSGASSAYVTQTGDNNDSDVTQTGNANYASVIQTTDDADSDILQSGDGNTALVSQDAASRSDVSQTGNSNYANVRQLVGSAGSFSQVRHTGNNNYADVAQSGAQNDSYVRVDGDSNSAYITQDGTNNAQRVRVIGTTGAGGSGNAHGNVAIQNQTATSSNNWSGIAQQGDNNYANVKQSGTGVIGDATPRSSDPFTRYDNYYNNEPPEADVWQVSNNNKAYIDQASDASRVTIYQGLSQIPQGSGNYAYAPGSDNFASVTQNASADGSRADVIQGGSNNVAYTTQDGANSESYLNQLGDGNFAQVTQTTNNNDSFVNQTGNGNVAVVSQ